MDNIKILPKYRVNGANNNVLSKKNNKRKTTEQYKEELKVKNPNVEVLEEYVNARTKILHEYKSCGHIVKVIPDRILRGSGCDYCNRKKMGQRNKKTTKQYKEELKIKNPNIEVLEEYVDSHTNILHRYNDCGHEAIISPTGALQGTGCIICIYKQLGEQKRKSHDVFVKEMNIKSPFIKIVGIYVKQNQRIDVQCMICNYNWSPYPSDLLSNRGCPNCSKSKGELYIKTLCDKYKIKYIEQKTYNTLIGIGGGLLSYDFYLPEYNMLIEYQGEQHKRPIKHFGGEEQFIKQQEHDRRKCEYAKQNNINLLEIWYYDFDNIESILLQKINELKENNLKLESVTTAISA